MATVYMIPSLLLFLHGEEYLVEGIANSGSVKGYSIKKELHPHGT